MSKSVTFKLVITHFDDNTLLNRDPRIVLACRPSARAPGRPSLLVEALGGPQLHESVVDLDPINIWEA